MDVGVDALRNIRGNFSFAGRELLVGIIWVAASPLVVWWVLTHPWPGDSVFGRAAMWLLLIIAVVGGLVAAARVSLVYRFDGQFLSCRLVNRIPLWSQRITEFYAARLVEQNGDFTLILESTRHTRNLPAPMALRESLQLRSPNNALEQTREG